MRSGSSIVFAGKELRTRINLFLRLERRGGFIFDNPSFPLDKNLWINYFYCRMNTHCQQLTFDSLMDWVKCVTIDNMLLTAYDGSQSMVNICHRQASDKINYKLLFAHPNCNHSRKSFRALLCLIMLAECKLNRFRSFVKWNFKLWCSPNPIKSFRQISVWHNWLEALETALAVIRSISTRKFN